MHKSDRQTDDRQTDHATEKCVGMGGVAPPSVTTPVYCTKTDPQVCEGALDDFVDVLSGQVQGVEHAVAGHELRHSDESSGASDLVDRPCGAGAHHAVTAAADV